MGQPGSNLEAYAEGEPGADQSAPTADRTQNAAPERTKNWGKLERAQKLVLEAMTLVNEVQKEV